MNTADLFRGLPLVRLQGGDVDVREIQTDSRAVRPGDLFMARDGWFVDSHQYLDDVVARGASALVVRRSDAIPAGCALPVWRSDHEDRDLGWLADRFYGEPTRALRVVAITGTNGKSTCVALIAWLLDGLGIPAARMGTVGYRFGAMNWVARNTTPDGRTIHGFARTALDRGARVLVMEASSHGIHLQRMAGVRLDVAAFTNLTHDHLDYHGSFASYEAAKATLFERDLAWSAEQGKTPSAVLAVDTDAGQRMVARVPAHVPWRGVRVLEPSSIPFDEDRNVRVIVRSPRRNGGFHIAVESASERYTGEFPLPGRFNVQNLGVALAVIEQLAPGRLGEALALAATFPGEAGRMERVGPPADGEFPVWVDYAHTPDAVGRVIEAVAGEGDVTVVLGCGGDRDRGKRPAMAAAAAEADAVFLTSDNPRSESPEAILDEMARGIPPDATSRFTRVVDRGEAIAAAVTRRQSGPVLILGKGHETTQEIAGQTHHFDDREMARRALHAVRGGVDAATVPRLLGWDVAKIADAVGGRCVTRGSGELHTGLCTDTRSLREGEIFVALRGRSWDAHAFLSQIVDVASIAIVEAGCVPDVAGTRTAFIEVECTRTALLALAAALLDEQRRAVRGFRVLAITGSNGKTSTRALASSLVSVEPGVCALSTEGNWNSQIGMPLIVSRLAPFHTHAVLELGISERGDMDELAGCVRPEVVIVTSIAEAHTEGLGGLDGVREQKARIVTSATETLIYPASEKGHAVWTERLPAQAVAWTVGDGVDADFRVARDGALGSVRIESDGVSRELALTVPGGFMGSNLAMAMCGVHALVFEGSATRRGAIESAGAEAALGRFAGPNGRMQRRDVGGWVVLDDTYNANPASVRAGFDVLAELPAPRVAVLGEMKELEGSVEAQHREVGAWARGRADVVVAVGAAMAHAGQAVGADVEFVAAPTVDDALQWFRRRGLSAGTVWVKGSRSSQMERFVAGLEQSVDSEA